jgi:hypothetical protein
LRKRFPTAEFAGVAGPKMKAAGCAAWFDSEALAVMGLTESLRHLPRLIRVARSSRIPAPDVFVGIDAPEFNLGLGSSTCWSAHRAIREPPRRVAPRPQTIGRPATALRLPPFGPGSIAKMACGHAPGIHRRPDSPNRRAAQPASRLGAGAALPPAAGAPIERLASGPARQSWGRSLPRAWPHKADRGRAIRFASALWSRVPSADVTVATADGGAGTAP